MELEGACIAYDTIHNQNQPREGDSKANCDDAIYNQNEEVFNQPRELEGDNDAIHNQNQQREGDFKANCDQNQQRKGAFNYQREGDYKASCDQNLQRNGALNDDYQREGEFKASCDQNHHGNGGFNDNQREGALNHSSSGEGGNSVERLSIDEVLKKWVGEFGRAQIVHFILTSLAWSLEALHTLVTVFADKTPPWRCITINNNTSIHTSFHASFNASNLQYNASNYACSPSSSLCGLAPGLWEWVRKHESTVSEWNLVCKSSYMQGLAQSSFFIGCLLGAGLCGHLSDSKLGRRGALVLTCMLNAVCGMLTAASPNYGVYTLLRAATGICSGGLGLTAFVLGTESIGPSHRTSAAMSALYFYPLGVLLLAGLAASTSHYSWRILYLITSTPSVLYCLFILPFLAESPRWYLIRGRAHEALQVLKTIAKTNGTFVPAGIVLFVEDQDNANDEKLKYDHHHDAGNMNALMPPLQPLTQDGLAAHEGSEMQQFDILALSCLQAETSSGIQGIHTLPAQLPIQSGSELREIKDSTNGGSGCDRSLPLENETEHHRIKTLLQHPPTMDGEQPRKAPVENGYELREMNTSPPDCQLAESESNHPGLHLSPPTPAIADGLEFTEDNEKKKLTNVTNVQKADGMAASGTLIDVFRSNDTRIRMIILVVVWFASALGYYAFNLNVGNLGTNLTMSVVLNALAEVPGYALATCLLHRIGRRITLISALLLSAFSSLLGAMISYRLIPYCSISKAEHLRSFIQLICSLVGLFSIAGTFNLLYLYTAELFPTVVRNAALGLTTQAGSIGSIIAPIVVVSAHVNITLPFFIIGVASLVSGVMAFKLPETLNCPFHETLEGMRRAKD